MSLTRGNDRTVRFASPANDGSFPSIQNNDEKNFDLLSSLESSLVVIRAGIQDSYVNSEEVAIRDSLSNGIRSLNKSECLVLLLSILTKFQSNRSAFDVGDLLVASEVFLPKPLGASLVYQTIESLVDYGVFASAGKEADAKTGRKSRLFEVTPVGRALAVLVVLMDRELRRHQSLAA